MEKIIAHSGPENKGYIEIVQKILIEDLKIFLADKLR